MIVRLARAARALRPAAIIWTACADDQPSNGCTPGKQVACSCGSGFEGFQICNTVGTAFGSCNCAADAGLSDGSNLAGNRATPDGITGTGLIPGGTGGMGAVAGAANGGSGGVSADGSADGDTGANPKLCDNLSCSYAPTLANPDPSFAVGFADCNQND